MSWTQWLIAYLYFAGLLFALTDVEDEMKRVERNRNRKRTKSERLMMVASASMWPVIPVLGMSVGIVTAIKMAFSRRRK